MFVITSSFKLFADDATAYGCVELLGSENTESGNLLYDRRLYYKHHVTTGYTLRRELAAPAVTRYYRIMFGVEKLLNNNLNKAHFCSNEIVSLNALAQTTKGTWDLYSGNAANDCLSILIENCKKPDFDFEVDFETLPVEKPSLELNKPTQPIENAFNELLSTELKYVNILSMVKPSADLIFQIITRLKNPSASAGLQKLFPLIVSISDSSKKLLNVLKSAYSSNDLATQLKSLAYLETYFKETEKSYKEYANLYPQYAAAANTADSSGSFLKKINNIFITPVQRALRYKELLSAIQKNMAGVNLGADQGEVEKIVNQVLQKALEFATEVNRP